MKKLFAFLLGAGLAVGYSVMAAPTTTFQRNIFPEITDTYDLGTSTKQWRLLTTSGICLSGDCQYAWPSSSIPSSTTFTSITTTNIFGSGLSVFNTTTVNWLFLNLTADDPTTTFYVDATLGSDTGECTIASPCKTTQYALNKFGASLLPGSAEIIHATGTYNFGSLSLPKMLQSTTGTLTLQTVTANNKRTRLSLTCTNPLSTSTVNIVGGATSGEAVIQGEVTGYQLAVDSCITLSSLSASNIAYTLFQQDLYLEPGFNYNIGGLINCQKNSNIQLGTTGMTNVTSTLISSSSAVVGITLGNGCRMEVNRDLDMREMRGSGVSVAQNGILLGSGSGTSLRIAGALGTSITGILVSSNGLFQWQSTGTGDAVILENIAGSIASPFAACSVFVQTGGSLNLPTAATWHFNSTTYPFCLRDNSSMYEASTEDTLAVLTNSTTTVLIDDTSIWSPLNGSFSNLVIKNGAARSPSTTLATDFRYGMLSRTSTNNWLSNNVFTNVTSTNLFVSGTINFVPQLTVFDIVGNRILLAASSSVTTLDSNTYTPTVVEGLASVLTLGNAIKPGVLILDNDGGLFFSNSSSAVLAQLFSNTLVLSSGNTTSTYGSSNIKLGSSPSQLDGVFFVQSDGDVSTSGTLKVFNSTLLNGLTATTATIQYLNATNVTTTNLTSALQGFIFCNGLSSPCTASLTIASSSITGLGNLAAQNSNAVSFSGGAASGLSISGGTIESTPIGSLGGLSTIQATQLRLGTGDGNLFANVFGQISMSSTLYGYTSSTFRTSTILGGFFQTDMADCSAENQTLNYNATTGKFTCLTDGGGSASSNFTTPLTVTDGSTTSTMTANSLFIATSTGNKDGLFFANSIGSISASGTLRIFGSSLLNGLTFTSASGTAMTSTLAIFADATSTNLNLSNSFSQTGFADCSSEANTVSYNATTGKFGCNTDSGGSAIFTGVTSTVVVVSTSLYSVATTTAMNLTEPSNIPSITAANTYAVYSDDQTRMLQFASTTAAATMYLRTGSFANANQMYFGTNAQSIASTLLYGTGSGIAGAVTYRGYHYVLVTSSTLNPSVSLRRATSSPNIDLSLLTSWRTTTISTQLMTSSARLVGAADGKLYFVSTTTGIVPYIITTSTNSIAASSPTDIITITGSLLNLRSTRVNDNGIYAGFAAAPFLRHYSLTGVTLGGLNALVAAPANGPDVFAMGTAIYGLAGGSTTNITKLNF